MTSGAAPIEAQRAKEVGILTVAVVIKPFVMESGKPDARYAVLEKGADGWEVDFIGVAYDSRRMAARARALGQESWAQALETGRVT